MWWWHYWLYRLSRFGRLLVCEMHHGIGTYLPRPSHHVQVTKLIQINLDIKRNRQGWDLKPLDTLGMHKITILWNFNCQIGRQICEIIMEGKNTLVTWSCVFSNAWFRDLKIQSWGLKIKFKYLSGKLLLSRKSMLLQTEPFFTMFYTINSSLLFVNKKVCMLTIILRTVSSAFNNCKNSCKVAQCHRYPINLDPESLRSYNSGGLDTKNYRNPIWIISFFFCRLVYLKQKI